MASLCFGLPFKLSYFEYCRDYEKFKRAKNRFNVRNEIPLICYPMSRIAKHGNSIEKMMPGPKTKPQVSENAAITYMFFTLLPQFRIIYR